MASGWVKLPARRTQLARSNGGDPAASLLGRHQSGGPPLASCGDAKGASPDLRLRAAEADSGACSRRCCRGRGSVAMEVEREENGAGDGLTLLGRRREGPVQGGCDRGVVEGVGRTVENCGFPHPAVGGDLQLQRDFRVEVTQLRRHDRGDAVAHLSRRKSRAVVRPHAPSPEMQGLNKRGCDGGAVLAGRRVAPATDGRHAGSGQPGIRCAAHGRVDDVSFFVDLNRQLHLGLRHQFGAWEPRHRCMEQARPGVQRDGGGADEGGGNGETHRLD